MEWGQIMTNTLLPDCSDSSDCSQTVLGRAALRFAAPMPESCKKCKFAMPQTVASAVQYGLSVQGRRNLGGDFRPSRVFADTFVNPIAINYHTDTSDTDYTHHIVYILLLPLDFQTFRRPSKEHRNSRGVNCI